MRIDLTITIHIKDQWTNPWLRNLLDEVADEMVKELGISKEEAWKTIRQLGGEHGN
jgi:hypothetical protein